jgi:CHRD domain
MKRLAAIGTALILAAACGSDSPTTPSGNTGPIIFTAQLSAANEVPPITNADANGRGTVTITFNVPRDASTGAVTGGGSVTFQAQLQGFPAGQIVRAAHIHPGAAGINGPVLVDTTLTAASPITLDSNGAGTINLTNSQLTQDQATQITANPAGYYFNVHTVTNTNGAIRGQLSRQ